MGAPLCKLLARADWAALSELQTLDVRGQRVSLSPQSAQLFAAAVGRRRSIVSPLHYDQDPMIICQLVGRKRVLLFPPSSYGSLAPYPACHPLDRRASLDVSACTPSAAEARELGGVEINLAEGEALYIPPYVWHEVSTVARGGGGSEQGADACGEEHSASAIAIADEADAADEADEDDEADEADETDETDETDEAHGAVTLANVSLSVRLRTTVLSSAARAPPPSAAGPTAGAGGHAAGAHDGANHDAHYEAHHDAVDGHAAGASLSTTHPQPCALWVAASRNFEALLLECVGASAEEISRDQPRSAEVASRSSAEEIVRVRVLAEAAAQTPGCDHDDTHHDAHHDARHAAYHDTCCRECAIILLDVARAIHRASACDCGLRAPPLRRTWPQSALSGVALSGGVADEARVRRVSVAAAARMTERELPTLLRFLGTPCALVGFLRRLPVCWP